MQYEQRVYIVHTQHSISPHDSSEATPRIQLEAAQAHSNSSGIRVLLLLLCEGRVEVAQLSGRRHYEVCDPYIDSIDDVMDIECGDDRE